MILQTENDDFHDASALLADLTRSEEILGRHAQDAESQVRIIKEIHAMMAGCKAAAAKGLPVQILALEIDERDEIDDGEEE